MKILLVEDDPKISSFVKFGLETKGFTVSVAYDSPMGLKLAMEKKFDIIILDVVIPGISGFDLCSEIRKNNIRTPVLMLTGLNSVEEKLQGFDCGADDYLTKPFDFHELLARINALNRRHKGIILKPEMNISGLEVDPLTLKVKRNGRDINVTSNEFKILEILIMNKYQVIERSYIARQLWGSTYSSSSNTIDVHISSLRKKIDNDFTPKLIHTKKGFGYMLSDKE